MGTKKRTPAHRMDGLVCYQFKPYQISLATKLSRVLDVMLFQKNRRSSSLVECANSASSLILSLGAFDLT